MIKRVGITGRGEKKVNNSFKRIDSIICFIEGTKYLNSSIRNIIFIGGESFGLIELNGNGRYKRHFVNTSCASGTGSFIDQQAKRMNLSTEELADLAEKFNGVAPQIATRCAVFAKSDIVHLQHEGYSKESICGGLCYGLARSILATILSGREIQGEIAVVGGVAKNTQVIKAIEERLGKKIIISKHPETVGAIGAALFAEEFKTVNSHLHSPLSLDLFKKEKTEKKREKVRPPLKLKLSEYPDFKFTDFYKKNDTEVALYKPLEKNRKYEVVLGIDIGSTSTKAVIVDYNKEALLSFYNQTSGDPIDATKRIFKCIIDFIQKNEIQFEIKAVGTTGSGRKLVKSVINADFEINEITAHAKAAIFIDPKVDTIIEIGGQDSKFTQIKDGSVYNSVMNYVCAAGTGSFIEEQAKKLDVKIEDYADLALGVEAPYTSDRCTVYMERDINVLLSKGWSKRQLLAAVLYSVRDNYINKVVNRESIGNQVYFQGATARNKALVAAFEELLGKPIHVSQYCHVTGAWGVCLLLIEQDRKKTKFIGLEFANVKTVTETETCELCDNACILTLFKSNKKTVAYGMMCGRDYTDKKPRKKEKKFFDAVKKHDEIMNIDIKTKVKKNEKIGIPNCLFMFEYQSLWKTFFNLLGYEVNISYSSRETIDRGMSLLTAEFCAPITMSHGHMQHLLDKNVDYIFFPAMIREKDLLNEDNLKLTLKKEKDCNFCYYTEYLPMVFKSLPAFDIENKIIDPIIDFDESIQKISQRIYKSFNGKLDVTEKEVKNAYSTAYNLFLKAKSQLEKFGKEELHKTKTNDEITIAILGRPYNALDKVINIDIPNKITDMGHKVLIQDMIATDDISFDYSHQFFDKMHWNYGQKLLKAAESIIKNDNLFPIYLTNFRCSPDSFIVEYFKEIMDRCGKPFIIMQLDAHGSDIGYITRIEAGIEAFKNWKENKKISSPPSYTPQFNRLKKENTILIPHVDDVVFKFIATTLKAYGYKTILMDENEVTINTGSRYVNGGECLPIAAMIGGVINSIEQYNLDPDKTTFYIPVVCLACNFSQFPILAKMVFEKLGWKNLQVYTANMMDTLPHTPLSLNLTMWKCNIIGCLLKKLNAKIKPYEINAGETDRVNEKAIELINEAILKKRNLKTVFRKVFDMFQSIKTSYVPKPKLAIVGDLYAKYNPILNQNVTKIVEDLGGEILIPSTTELILFHRVLDLNVLKKHKRLFKYSWAALEYNVLKRMEKKYEKIVQPLIGDQEEPSIEEVFSVLDKYGIKREMSGETPLGLGRAIILLEKGLANAIINVNPIFCCPGIISSSIFERIQKDYNVPIINIFYDGTGDHNKVLIPHLNYLKSMDALCKTSPDMK